MQPSQSSSARPPGLAVFRQRCRKYDLTVPDRVRDQMAAFGVTLSSVVSTLRRGKILRETVDEMSTLSDTQRVPHCWVAADGLDHSVTRPGYRLAMFLRLTFDDCRIKLLNVQWERID